MIEGKTTKFCSNCGAKIDIKAKFCPKCGIEQFLFLQKVSNWWYLVSILFGIIGGVIAWVANKDLDPQKARKLLIVGLVMPIIWFFLGILFFIGVFLSIFLQ
jgi:hypothetical protein